MEWQTKRKVMRLFTYGMYAVSAHHNEMCNAFLANWLTQCSFDPPMVMISVEREARTLELIRGSGFFAVHVLASGQREFAGMLGRSSRTVPDKLKNVRWHPSPLTRCPILEETLGYIECRVAGELPAGDSVIVVGEVIDARMLSNGEPAPLTMQEAGFKHAG
ncbi:3-hydroxy-9,10-secoandrosta-1,3,5(10)-triene-9, 17-dione monooxygenase reductase component [Anaerolineae bacterium]|nr:3-hydroxy-9,10-secoandrosta-1,3,5(10)-triene-9, 17-dione monooxygenase reductase component [Anaerolineae bacterium]